MRTIKILAISLLARSVGAAVGEWAFDLGDALTSRSNVALPEEYWQSIDARPDDIILHLDLILTNKAMYSIDNVNAKRFVLRYLVLDRLALGVDYPPDLLPNSILDSMELPVQIICDSDDIVKAEIRTQDDYNRAALFFYEQMPQLFMDLLLVGEMALRAYAGPIGMEAYYQRIIQFLIVNDLEYTFECVLLGTRRFVMYINVLFDVIRGAAGEDSARNVIEDLIDLQKSAEIENALIRVAINMYPTNGTIYSLLVGRIEEEGDYWLVELCGEEYLPEPEAVMDRIIALLERNTFALADAKISSKLCTTISKFPKSEFLETLLDRCLVRSSHMVMTWLMDRFSFVPSAKQLLLATLQVNPNRARRLMGLFEELLSEPCTVVFARALVAKSVDEDDTCMVLRSCEVSLDPPLRSSAVLDPVHVQIPEDILLYILEVKADLITRLFVVPRLSKTFARLDIWSYLRGHAGFMDRISEDLVLCRRYLCGLISRVSFFDDFLLNVVVFAPDNTVPHAKLSENFEFYHEDHFWRLLFEAFGGSPCLPAAYRRSGGYWEEVQTGRSASRRDMLLRYVYGKLLSLKNEVDFLASLCENLVSWLVKKEAYGNLTRFVANLLESRSQVTIDCLKEKYKEEIQRHLICGHSSPSCACEWIQKHRNSQERAAMKRLDPGLAELLLFRFVLIELCMTVDDCGRRPDDRLSALQGLNTLLQVKKYAEEMDRLNLWRHLIDAYDLGDTDSAVMSVFATAARNNKSVQKTLLRHEILHVVIDALKSRDDELVEATVEALDALVSDSRVMFSAFCGLNGLDVLIDAFAKSRETTAALVQNLILKFPPDFSSDKDSKQ